MDKQLEEFKQAFEIMAKIYGYDIETIEIVNRQNDIEILKAAFTMLQCGVKQQSVSRKLVNNDTVDMFMSECVNKLTEKYGMNDKLHEQIKQANQLAVSMTEQNTEIRKMFESDVKVAIDRERQSQKMVIKQYDVAIEAKTQAYSEIKERYLDLKEEYDKEHEQMQANEKEIKELQAKLQIASTPNSQDVNISEHVKLYKLQKKGLLQLFTCHSKKEDSKYRYEKFINEIVNNARFNEAQKIYLCNCLENGMPYCQVRKIANPDISIDMMKMLKHYYDNNII